MKTFKELAYGLSESPVGKVGRTKDSEAKEHIENTDIEKRFKKIVKELGGKAVAKHLLATMFSSTDNIQENTNTNNPSKFIVDLGIKIKDENYNKYSFELEFFKSDDAKKAYTELKKANFLDYYNITLVDKHIEFEEL